MSNYEIAVTCSVLSYFFAIWSGIPKAIKKITGLKKIKPLDCEQCLTFHSVWIWFALKPHFVDNLENMLFTISIAIMLTQIISNLDKRINGLYI